MAVTKQTYTATATWTASQLADTFKTAFIDAGLMLDWFDSFLNTVENRILRVIYDGSKANGTVYYWFQFTTTGVFVSTALGWNASTHVPTGTQYLDYYSVTTNATTNHIQLITLASTTSVTVTRYTSAINTGYTWFLIKNGTTNFPFLIPSPTYGPSSLIDQDKMAFAQMLTINSTTSINIAYMDFASTSVLLRKSIFGATTLRGTTTLSNYQISIPIFRYGGHGNVNNTSSNASATSTGTWLPTAFANTNTALAADHNPVFTSPTISPYQSQSPADFGIVSYYASSTMAVQDTFVVSSGTEEWEMVAVAPNAVASAAKLLFLARTVG